MPKADLHKSIEGFSPISLEQMNESMTLMSRKERKFVCDEDKLAELIEAMKDEYRILTINGLDVFSYNNFYMDTKEYEFYHTHQEWSKVRTKVRTRQYCDSWLYFFEYKQRHDNQITKYRYDIAPEDHGRVTLEWVRFFQGLFESIYQEKFKKLLFPVLNNTYNRITFCRNSNDERITVDFNIQYFDPERPGNTHNLKNVAIIESKADVQPAPSDDLLSKLWLTEQHACSKYCVGMHYLGKVKETSHFDHTIARMDEIAKMVEWHERTEEGVQAVIEQALQA